MLVICTHPFAKKSLTLNLARGEGREPYFGCNLMHRKVLALRYCQELWIPFLIQAALLFKFSSIPSTEFPSLHQASYESGCFNSSPPKAGHVE